MAKKNNIRSIRFSDEMIEMIESQVGETFTAKFEALVTRCMWELPAKEKELTSIQRHIEIERARLHRISSYINQVERNAQKLNMTLQQSTNQLNQAVKSLEQLIEKP